MDTMEIEGVELFMEESNEGKKNATFIEHIQKEEDELLQAQVRRSGRAPTAHFGHNI